MTDGVQMNCFSTSTILEVTSMENAGSIQELKQAILDFEEDKAVVAANKVVKEGAPAIDAIGAMGDALTELGDKFQAMEVFLPEVLLATDAFKAALKILEPELKKSVGAAVAAKPKVLIGTVKGDVHAVGKDMVTTLLTVGGFDVKDLGVDVDSEAFINEAEAFGAQIIALSALMSTTMPNQKEVIDFLKAKNLRDKFKVMIGGGPTTLQWAESIGADGYSKDAVGAVALAKNLLDKK
jgi:trimethylamine corrinoid protein